MDPRGIPFLDAPPAFIRARLYRYDFAPLSDQAFWRRTLVGEWTIQGNVAVSEDTVGFFAPSPEDVAALGASLDRFAPELPPSVRYRPRGR